MRSKPIRLRVLAIVGVAAFTLLTLFAAAILFVSGAELSRISRDLQEDSESIRAAGDLKSNLLVHARETQLMATSSDPGLVEAQADARERLDEALVRTRKFTSSAAEAVLVDQVAHDLSAYLASSGDGHEPLVARASADQALADIEKVAELNYRDTLHDEASAQAWHDRARLMTLGVGVALGLWAVAFLLQVRRLVFRPLGELNTALQRYSTGDRTQRAPEMRVVELQEMAQTFNRMADALARQQQVQLDSLAAVAHDLRNPLSALKMAASMLRPERPLPPEASLRKMLSLLGRQVDSLDRQATDLLDTARLEAGDIELRMEQRDLREFAAGGIELYRPVSSRHQLRLVAPEDPVILSCDPVRMEQVMNNLLSNAIKYSPKGGEVRIEVGQREGEGWISVVDEGVGISAEQQAMVFQPFHRSHRENGAIPGVGLGLSVVRRIVNAHSGRIELESVEGRGSRFTVTLPLAQAAGADDKNRASVLSLVR